MTRPRAPQRVRFDLDEALDMVRSLAGHAGHDRCTIALSDEDQAAVRLYLDSWVIPRLQRTLLWAHGADPGTPL